jgi:hypothetical protein
MPVVFEDNIRIPVLDSRTNYVAFAVYKHILKGLHYTEAQDYCLRQLRVQNQRLAYSLMQAIKIAKPELNNWWYYHYIKRHR